MGRVNRRSSLQRVTNRYTFLTHRTPSSEVLELQRKPIVEIERLDAARLRDRFQVVFGDRIQLASELAVGPVVDGLPWTLTGSLSLSECGLEWMAPVVLTVFAYGGSQGRGTATQTFGSALRELKELRLAWVDRLEVGLWRGEERITSTPVPALVLDGPAIVADRQIQDRYGELADVLSDVVHRGDHSHPSSPRSGQVGPGNGAVVWTDSLGTRRTQDLRESTTTRCIRSGLATSPGRFGCSGPSCFSWQRTRT